MFVCSCNALTDADMRRAISTHGLDRPAAVFAACNCRAQCGTCVRTVCALLGLGAGCGRGRDAVARDTYADPSFVQQPNREVRHAA